MADTKKIVDTYKQLTQEWSKKPPNIDKCGAILDSLKVRLYLSKLDSYYQIVTLLRPPKRYGMEMGLKFIQS